MSWDSVPWFVGGGAEHSPEVARLLAYAATSGAEGIVSPGDLKVLPLNVPGSSVRVSLGAALIRNRAVGGTAQTYVARNPIEDVVAIAATGSGGGRSDLIVAQIEDPFMAGEPWQDPVDPKVGPYIFTRVISNVPAGTTSLQGLSGYGGRSAVVLARIDLPASTGTVTAGMIVDLRKVALPRRQTELRTFALAGSDQTTLTNTADYPAGGQTYPVATETAWGELPIPEWATRMKIVMTWAGVYQPRGDARGNIWVQVGRTDNPSNVKTQSVVWDSPAASSASRFTMIAADEIAVPAALRGTRQKFYPRANISAASATASRLSLDYGSAMILQVEFLEQAS